MSAGHSPGYPFSAPPVEAPEGRVALVVARLSGASALWESRPEATGTALRLATSLLARLTVEHQGYEVRAEGETFVLAFSSPLSAARWCVAAQRALVDAEWPPKLLEHPESAIVTMPDGRPIQRGLRYAIAMHVGTPNVVREGGAARTSYGGEVMDFAEQVASMASGGQVLLTPPAWSAVDAMGVHLLDDADYQEVGPHRVSGREEAISLVQLLPGELASRTFPPIGPATSQRTNLPEQPGLFVGRERILSAIGRMFDSGRRVVTLKGPGGMGKTRLALRYGGLHLDEYSGQGGVWFCDLSEARSIDSVVYAVARSLGISVRARSLQGTQQLGYALASRGRCLLIIDNFEQLSQYAELTLGQWVRKAPQLRILVTSRHRLELPGEALIEVMPLDTDDAEALFIERAQRVCPTFAIDSSNQKVL
jgi:class 3 adenylate cyclase